MHHIPNREREINALKEKIDDLKSSLFALYQTKRGKKHNCDEALNQAIVQADCQRRATFEELNKRLMAIRQAPEEAIHQNLPDLSGNQEDDVEEKPQPSTSAQAYNPPRSRPNQRWASNQGQARRDQNQEAGLTQETRMPTRTTGSRSSAPKAKAKARENAATNQPSTTELIPVTNLHMMSSFTSWLLSSRSIRS